MTTQHELGSAQLWTATYPARLGTCTNQFWCWEGNNFATHKVHSGNLIAKGESTGSRSRRTEHLLRMRKARCVPAAVVSPWSMRLYTESRHLLGRTHNQCTPTHLHISWWHTHNHAGVRRPVQNTNVFWNKDRMLLLWLLWWPSCFSSFKSLHCSWVPWGSILAIFDSGIEGRSK